MSNPDLDQPVGLLDVAVLIHDLLDEAACEAIFEDVRTTERRRDLTLWLLFQFWTSVMLRAPRSLSQALEEAAAGSPPETLGYPQIGTSKQAFFQRCQDLRPEFFQALFEEFVARVMEQAPPTFNRRFHEEIAPRFSGRLLAIDGSSLDQVARRLIELRDDARVPLPGTILAFYDICAGIPLRLHHFPELQPKESPKARESLEGLPEGALLLGDRLYGQPGFMADARQAKLEVLARRNGRVKFSEERALSDQKTKQGQIEDWLGTYGTSSKTNSQQVRLIRKIEGDVVFEVVTTVLDPEQLSAEEALDLYRARWSVERLFHDLKVVLNLKHFYAANLNAVSMQLYTAAIVYVALRLAQSRIADEVGVEPEELSVQRLFVKVSVTSAVLTILEGHFRAVCEANPGKKLQKPDWSKMPFASVILRQLMKSKRGPGGRKPRIKSDRRRVRSVPDRGRR